MYVRHHFVKARAKNMLQGTRHRACETTLIKTRQDTAAAIRQQHNYQNSTMTWVADTIPAQLKSPDRVKRQQHDLDYSYESVILKPPPLMPPPSRCVSLAWAALSLLGTSWGLGRRSPFNWQATMYSVREGTYLAWEHPTLCKATFHTRRVQL